jgi:hypothetical protein
MDNIHTDHPITTGYRNSARARNNRTTSSRTSDGDGGVVISFMSPMDGLGVTKGGERG